MVIMPEILTTGEVKRRIEFEEVTVAVKTIEDGMVVDDLMLDDISANSLVLLTW